MAFHLSSGASKSHLVSREQLEAGSAKKQEWCRNRISGFVP